MNEVSLDSIFDHYINTFSDLKDKATGIKDNIPAVKLLLSENNLKILDYSIDNNNRCFINLCFDGCSEVAGNILFYINFILFDSCVGDNRFLIYFADNEIRGSLENYSDSEEFTSDIKTIFRFNNNVFFDARDNLKIDLHDLSNMEVMEQVNKYLKSYYIPDYSKESFERMKKKFNRDENNGL